MVYELSFCPLFLETFSLIVYLSFRTTPSTPSKFNSIFFLFGTTYYYYLETICCETCHALLYKIIDIRVSMVNNGINLVILVVSR